jgi:nitrate reductase (NAD(P)H)
MMPHHHIGTLDEVSREMLKQDAQIQPAPSDSGEIFLQPRAWKKAELREKRSVSWDTQIFTFKLDREDQSLGLPVGQHLMLKLKSEDDESIIRAYTPTSHPDQKGTVEVLIKVYFDTPTSKGGKMTLALNKLAIGSTVDFKGPIGKFRYLGNGRVLLNDKGRHVSSFRMICGGSGITPIFQVLRAVMQNPLDPTDCVVLDGNRLENDILCREELNAFAVANGSRCTIVHTLTEAPGTWMGLQGRITDGLLKQYAAPGEKSLALICGPEGMEASVRQILLAQGWDEADLVFF